MPADAPPSAPAAPVWPTVGSFAVSRLAGNTFLRFPYVFITAVSSGLGVSVPTFTTILGLRELGGVATPVFGRLVDRGHLRRTMIAAGAVAGGTCAASVLGGPWWFGAAMVVGGAAKLAIDVAQNAWMGHHVALGRRARAVGLVELSWSAAFLAGVPLLAWVIDRWGWSAAFVVTGVVLAVATVVVGLRLDERATQVEHPAGTGESPVRDGLPPHRRRAVLAFAFLQPLTQMLVFAVNGDWFVGRLGLDTRGVGAAAVLLGVAELAGTLLTVAVTDRIGPARAGSVGMAVAVPALVVLGTTGHSVVAGLAALVVADVALEFSFVSVLPLFSELDPANRGASISQAFVLMTLARAGGSAVAGWIYVAGGIGATGLAAGAAAGAAAGMLAAGRRHPPPATSTALTPGPAWPLGR